MSPLTREHVSALTTDHCPRSVSYSNIVKCQYHPTHLTSAPWNLMRTWQKSYPMYWPTMNWIIRSLCLIVEICKKDLSDNIIQHKNILLVKEFWQIFGFLCLHLFFFKLHSAVVTRVVSICWVVTKWSQVSPAMFVYQTLGTNLNKHEEERIKKSVNALNVSLTLQYHRIFSSHIIKRSNM